jgi:hypothetical protein
MDRDAETSADAGGRPDDTPVVDGTLIDEMLRLTPEERLRQNDRMVRTVEELRNGFAAQRAHEPPDRARRSGR